MDRQRDGCEQDTLISSLGWQKSLRVRVEKAAQSVFVVVCVSGVLICGWQQWILAHRHFPMLPGLLYSFLQIHYTSVFHWCASFSLSAGRRDFSSFKLLMANIKINHAKTAKYIKCCEISLLILVKMWIHNYRMPVIRKQHTTKFNRV